MPAYKDKKTGKWYVKFYYEDHTGKLEQKKKMGFSRRSDALDWQDDFIKRKKGSINMSFNALWEEYKENLRHEIKESTWETKIQIVDSKILPFFGDIGVSEIDELMIRKWQNKILGMKNKRGEPYSGTYVKSINNQLSAILNHAVTYYKLPYNPIHRTGSIGEKHADERNFWTLEEFQKVMEYYKDDLAYSTAYNIFFFTGIRQGELLALTLNDIDLDNKKMIIKTNWGKRKQQLTKTSTKTKLSHRTIALPDFLLQEIQKYVDSLYGYEPHMRLFSHLNKYYINKGLRVAAEAVGIDPITNHELRHSHASLLINNDVNIKAIQQRLGHKNIDTTLNTYSHLYADKQQEVADMINNIIVPL